MKLPVPSRHSSWRMIAYQCEIDNSGYPIKQKSVTGTGWYGKFSENALKMHIMPVLANHSLRGISYPFLIISHKLQETSIMYLPETKSRKLTISDVRISPRKKHTPDKLEAIVYSPTQYKLINNIHVD